jgi:hypothetical protein
MGRSGGDCRAVIRLWRLYFDSDSGLSRLQSVEAYSTVNRANFGCHFFSYRNFYSNHNHFINNHLIFKNMSKLFLLGANEAYDTNIQVAVKGQVIQMNGYEYDRYAVYDVIHGHRGFMYKLINLRTHKFGQCDMVRPLSQKFGIGYYFDEENPQFMNDCEIAALRSEAERIEQEAQEKSQKREERNNQLRAIGRERLQRLIPEDAKAVIIAELHQDKSDAMTDYFDYRTTRIVILGFSTHTKDLFSEMRKYAANFEETAYLTEKNEEYEHREKYTCGDGYYLGKSKYHGWTVKKETFFKDRENIINDFSLIAGDEANICVKVQTGKSEAAPETVTGDFIIVNYSEKALAVFGDTKPIKDQLMTLGGRFNPKLAYEDGKKAGWIFSKSKEQELRNLLTIK